VFLAAAVNALLFFVLAWVNHRAQPPERPDVAAYDVWQFDTPELPEETITPESTLPGELVEMAELEPLRASVEMDAPAPRLLAARMPALPDFIVPFETALRVPTPEPIAPREQNGTATAADIVPQATSGPYSQDDVDRPARRSGGQLPAYPLWARRRGIEGAVVLRFTVDATGAVGDVEIVSTRGSVRFGDLSARSARGWTFEPAMKSGHPVAVRCEQTITFRLEEER